MKLSVKSIVNSLLTVDNAIRLYVCVMLVGPATFGFIAGLEPYRDTRSEFQTMMEFVVYMIMCIVGVIELPKVLSRLPLRGECSLYIRINLLTYALYALVAMVVTAVTTNRAMLLPGPWRDIIWLLGLVIILPIWAIYLVCVARCEL